MECNRDEAARVKALAERKMLDKDFVGAKKIIIKVQQLLKEVEDVDIPKMLTVCDVHCAAGAKVNNEIDWYGILQVPVNADDTLIKKQYRKLAFLLHPDKNTFGGAEAAFKLVGEANITLTDRSKRYVYDMKRNTFRNIITRPNHQPPKRPAPARSSFTPVNLHNIHQQHQHQASNPTMPQTTFWTICPACGMRYQYYLSILKKALHCQNCLKPFIAHDLTDQAIPSVANQRSAGIWKTAGTPQNSAGPQTNDSTSKRLRKSGLFHGDLSTKTAKLNEDTAGHDGLNSCSNIKDDTKNAECSYVRSHDRDPKHAGLSSGNRKGSISINVGQGQHTKSVNAGIPTKTPKEEKIRHNTHLPEVTDVDDDDNICQTEYVCADSEFYDFSEIRLLQRFSPGQIWALYSDIDKFPNYYAFIHKVDRKNDKVQVRWLDVCPQGDVEKRLSQERTISIGTFRLASVHEMVTYTGTDAFSHPAVARSTGRKGEYEIFPRFGEIWAVYKNWRAGWTAQDFEKCEYELVEIFGYTDSSIQVRPVRKVDGYKTIFMLYSAGSVKTIRKDEYPKFSHRIPCFHLTHEKGGKLRGYLELDPFSLPGEFLY